ncbi:MAG TPA: 4Fe-4S dicluster domain-containing protein [Ignisphaera sp.]|nr:4Fe-4S dicluster domain-containing protein [Ignisphaera sp.]
MPRRIVWPIVKKVYWCENCNMPVLASKCPKCGGEVYRLPLSDPGDARPAFERDYKALRAAYIYEFGTEKGLETLLGKSVLLLNKAPYVDEMREVVSDGVQIGRLYFEPLLRRWRFRLSKAGALRLVNKYPDLVEKIVVDKKRYIPMDTISVSKELRPRQQVLLVRANGKIVGLGYAKSKHKVIVHSWWGDDSPDIERYGSRPSTFDDVIKAHEEHMRIMESKSMKLIATMYEKVRKPIVASFSGGKDSLVALSLVLDLGYEPKVLFNNTGIELPETVDTVYKIVDKFGLELVEASAGDIFWHAVYKLGIPGRDYRWCCKVCKLAPLARTVKSLWSNGALNIVGQRAFESLDRARNPSVWRLRWAPQLLNISPINYWSQLEVWMYIHKKKLYVNPLYYMGYERIGCFMCPASTLAELQLVSETHPSLWSKWLEALEYWAKRLNKPREWIEYALWRWNAPARYRTLMAKKLKVVDRIDNWYETFSLMVEPRIVSVEKTQDFVRVEFSDSIDLRFLNRQLSIVKPSRVLMNNTKAVLEWGTAKVVIESNSMTVFKTNDYDVEKLVDIIKLYYRWLHCVGCRSCEANCPVGAFRVHVENGRLTPHVHSEDRCISCKLCLYNCPIAEVFVEHVIAPLIFDDPEAWRRKTREHQDEVLKKIKALLRKIRPELFSRSEEVGRKGEYASTAAFFDMTG